MSRSRKKQPYSRYVCMKNSSVRKSKKQVNRLYRRRMKQGRYDEDTQTPSLYKRHIDLDWDYEMIKGYFPKEKYPDFYEKLMRKK